MGQLFHDQDDIENYENLRKQLNQLNQLERKLDIGIFFGVAVILFVGWYGDIITFPLFQNLAWSVPLVSFMVMEE